MLIGKEIVRYLADVMKETIEVCGCVTDDISTGSDQHR